ncbi:hypothetical protein [Bordetella petrii]|uniref:Uncharacterized protein n=1 Tax=Bordetella petrii (strain ATCC BAA-461 / DSM 12804 / CCUG 43448 / CIP 107267 / Se-1111R) TaxID=340100 RepID=A9I917_BORPD|nr:hypothetical protein [Bordetella petrii]CAP41317.1 hypothetical protein predicted by Glimmer/Critica [Bordetella petrii]
MGFRRPQTIRPRAEGGYVKGRWVEGADAAPYTIQASVQPARLSDHDVLQPNPEGRRITAAVRIYTTAVLNVAGQDDQNGDRLVWDRAPHPGEYLVVAVSPWQSGVISHYRYLAVLQND